MTKHKIYMEDLIYPILTDKKERSLVGSKLRCSIKVLPGGAKSFDCIRLIGMSLLITIVWIICHWARKEHKGRSAFAEPFLCK